MTDAPNSASVIRDFSDPAEVKARILANADLVGDPFSSVNGREGPIARIARAIEAMSGKPLQFEMSRDSQDVVTVSVDDAIAQLELAEACSDLALAVSMEVGVPAEYRIADAATFTVHDGNVAMTSVKCMGSDQPDQMILANGDTLELAPAVNNEQDELPTLKPSAA